MPFAYNRRAFLANTFTAAACFPTLDSIIADERSLVSNSQPEKTKPIFEMTNTIPPVPDTYIKLVERKKRKEGFSVAEIQYFVHKHFWETLPPGLSQSEFYKELNTAPFKNVTTIVLAARKNPVTTQEFLNEFLLGADTFIRNTTPPDYYKLDPEFRFTAYDKKILEELLVRKLTSPVVQKNTKTGEKIQVYLRRTKIITEVEYFNENNSAAGLADPTISLYVRLPDSHKYLYGKRKMTLEGVNEKARHIEKAIFMKMQKGILLTHDVNHSPKREVFVPLEYLYEKYLHR